MNTARQVTRRHGADWFQEASHQRIADSNETKHYEKIKTNGQILEIMFTAHNWRTGQRLCQPPAQNEREYAWGIKRPPDSAPGRQGTGMHPSSLGTYWV